MVFESFVNVLSQQMIPIQWFLTFGSSPEGMVLLGYAFAVCLGFHFAIVWERYNFCQPQTVPPKTKRKTRHRSAKLPGMCRLYHKSYFEKYRIYGLSKYHLSPEKIEQTPETSTDDDPWDDPTRLKKINAADFARVTSAIKFEDDLTSDLEPDKAPTKYKMFNLGTRKGCRQFRRWKKQRKSQKIEANTAVTTNRVHGRIANLINLTARCGRKSNPDEFEIIWDTGASRSISFDKNDFVDGIDWFDTQKQASGLANGLTMLGIGMVQWELRLNDNTSHIIKVPAYYAPNANRRLLSPQQLLQYLRATNASDKSNFTLTADGLHFRHAKGQIQVDFDATSNLPISYACVPKNEALCLSVEEMNACITTHQNQNLSAAQKELLRLHFRFGHISLARIQAAIKTGAIATTKTQAMLHKRAASCEIQGIRCAACVFAKARRRPLPGHHKTTPDVENAGNIAKGKLLPGAAVAVDHFICSTKGRLFGSAGKTAPSSMYCGGCVFTDMATGFIHVEPVTNTSAHATLEAKAKFEVAMWELGIKVREYHLDKGSAFTSDAFTSDLVQNKQKFSYAGVGAHSQNGIAERAIQTIVYMARTMMIHSSIHWPGVADTCLWPMAVQAAVYIHNRFPRIDNNLSPYELLTSSRWERQRLMNLHVWGSPVYVLDPRIQDGKTIPKWKPRSRRGMYLGLSHHHAATVPSVLNLQTHRITAQYHCVFDDWFSTVDLDPDEVPDFNSDQWISLFERSTYRYEFDPDDGEPPPLDADFRDSEARTLSQRGRRVQFADIPAVETPPEPQPTVSEEAPTPPTVSEEAPVKVPEDAEPLMDTEDPTIPVEPAHEAPPTVTEEVHMPHDIAPEEAVPLSESPT